MDTTSLELSVPSEIGNERYAMDFAEDVALEMGFPAEKIENLKIAVAEACLNAIEHGHKQNRNMKVLIDFTISDTQLEINVQDRGKKFKPETIEKPDLKEMLANKEAPKRGWGMYIIKNMVDEMEYLNAGTGTRLRMVVKLPADGRETRG